jgi:hypothetical protein
MAAEVDLTRTMNTLAQTLNDQKLGEFDPARVQELTNGATGGEFKFAAYGSGTSGELRDGSVDGEPVARVSLNDGEWLVERVPETRKSAALQQAEQQREDQMKTEYQKPLRGRLAIWKKYLGV